MADGGDCRTFAHEVGHTLDLNHLTTGGNLMFSPRPAADVHRDEVPLQLSIITLPCPNMGTASAHFALDATQIASVQASVANPTRLTRSPTSAALCEVLGGKRGIETRIGQPPGAWAVRCSRP